MSLGVPPGAVDVWLADIVTAAENRTLLALLAPDELGRIARYRHAAARRRSLVAHALLHEALAEWAGDGTAPLVAQRCPRCGQPHGKPQLVTADGRPRSDLHASLTHAGDLAAVALAPAPVGVDLEPLPPDAPAACISVALSPRELEALARADAPDRSIGVFTAWTRKEALFKAGCGDGDLDRLDLCELDLPPATGHTHGPQRWRSWLLWDIVPADGYVGAVALAQPR